MMDLLKEIEGTVRNVLPKEAEITKVDLEGPEIAIYTRNPKAFFENENFVAKIAFELKKRVNIRTDKTLLIDEVEARKKIMEIIPTGADVKDIAFNQAFSEVVIEAIKPGLVIGKGGETSKRIILETGWTPNIVRAPTSKSEILQGIRHHLNKYSGERKKILQELSEKIYRKIDAKEDDWIRLTALGGFREVGRSSILLETPSTRVLLDCGIDVSNPDKPYPYLDSLRFPLNELDAVIISHAHVDHSGFTPYLFKMGYHGPVYCSVDYEEPVIVKENEKIKTIKIGEIIDSIIDESEEKQEERYNQFVAAKPKRKIEVPCFSRKDYKIRFKEVKEVIRHAVDDDLFEITLKTGRTVKVTGSHSVFALKNREIVEKKVNEICEGDYLVVPQRIPTQKIKSISIADKLKEREYFFEDGKVKTKQSKAIPQTLVVCKELMRILGYFASEGNLEKRGIRFSFGLKDEEPVKDLKNCTRTVFGLEAKEKIKAGNVISVSVNSIIVMDLFKNYFFNGYKKATTKHVPEIIFNVSKELKMEFVDSYFKGDGTINLLNKTAHAVSVSKRLISDLSYLLTQIGINYTLFSKHIASSKTKNIAHRITINLSDFGGKKRLDKKSIETVPLSETNFGSEWYYHRLRQRKHVTKERLKSLINKGWVVNTNGSTLQVQENLLKLAESDLGFLQVVKIKKVPATNGFVYDFAVEEDQNFIGGNAPICLHNTEPTRDLMALLHFDAIDVMVKEGKEPLYSERDVKEMVKYCVTRDYREVTDIAPDMRLTLHNAAHILGSASVHLHIGEGAHNLVYSLDEKTPVTVFDKGGNLKIIEIGKLVDRQIRKHGIGSGFVEEASNFNGWKTIAFNPKTLKSEIVEITSFIRHPINEDLFEINTVHGRKVSATGSHSVFTVSNGIVKSVEAKELKIGDYIICSKKMRLTGKKIFVDLPKNEFALKASGKELKQQLKAIKRKAKKLFPEKQKEILLWVKAHAACGLYENAIARKFNVSRKTVRKYFKKLGIKKNPRAKNTFPAKIELTKELARFIGYFVSEGSFNKNTVIISQYNPKMLKDSLGIIKKAFGIKGKIVKKEAQFYSKQIVLFLKKVLRCGNNAYTKRIPRQLALAKDEVIAEYLKGYFIGDGSLRIRKKGASINCASKSKLLIQETAFLLLRLGITPTFEYNKSSKMHNLHVYGRNQLENFIEKIRIMDWEKRLKSYPAQKIKSNSAERIPIKLLSQETQEIINKTAWQNANCCGTATIMKISQNTSEKALIESDLTLDEIASIRKVRSTGNFVYDLSIRGYENFLGGWGHLFLHNSGDIKYGFTRLFNNVDMKYPRLETLIIESTYGSREDIQPDRMQSEERLLQIIRETARNGGSTLIPVFAVGRAQEIMLVLEDAYRRGMLEAKVYVDGMTKEASAIHTAYPEFLRKGVQRRILQNDSPFTSDIFQIADPSKREKAVNEAGAVILASSGMLTGGASVQYLHMMAENPANTLVFVGYQGEGSMGRKLQGGVKEIPITQNGRTKALKINMRVETTEGFSVPYETELMIRENNEFLLIQIGKIADKLIPKEIEGIEKLCGLEVATFDENGKIKMANADKIIKHKTKGKHLIIKTKSGKEIQASKGHSLFCLKDGKIKSIASDKISNGDHLIIAGKLPESNTITNIEFKDFVSLKGYNLIKENGLGRFDPIKGGNKKSFLNSACNDMNAIGTFLGYYAAEGHKEKGKSPRCALSFGSFEKGLIKNACHSITDAFGITPTLFNPHKTETQIRVNNKLVANFLENIGVGENAATKRIPSIVFNLPFESQERYLKAYFAGDGYKYKNGGKGYLAAKSASKKLLSDLSYLLLQRGIISRIKGPFKQKERVLNGNLLKESTCYKLYISETGFKTMDRQIGYPPFALPLKEIKIKTIAKLVKDRKLKKLAYDYVHNLKNKGRKYVGIRIVKKFLEKISKEELTGEEKELVKTIDALVLGDIAADPVVEIKEAETQEEFEYDISVPATENFCGGIGGIMLHNSGHSDRMQLVNYVRNLKPKPKRILVDHGEKSKTIEFAKYLSAKFRINTTAPRNLDSVRLR